ncbi:MAG: ATP-binding protein, partial [Betaproteobacteria bacterium]
QRLSTGDAEIIKYLDMVSRNADRAAGLTQRLLAFSRNQPLDPAQVDPNTLVTGMAQLLEQTLGESYVIEIAPGSDVMPVSVDANQLETALVNLALNARDAMPRGGKLRLATSMVMLDESTAGTRHAVQPGTYVLIAVSDTGSGMSDDVVARAFDPFFTTKEPGQGTGLGLSQVFGFIKQSGGHVAIRSKPGVGTIVNLYLPRLDPSATQRPSPALAAGQSARSTGTILVVEDNADIRLFTGNVLRKLGYRALDAHDARSALEVLESQQVDVLFTDVGLPNGRNGQELAYEARTRWPHLKVLFATGYADRTLVDRLDGVEAVLFKPFNETALAEAMQNLLRNRAARFNAADAVRLH